MFICYLSPGQVWKNKANIKDTSMMNVPRFLLTTLFDVSLRFYDFRAWFEGDFAAVSSKLNNDLEASLLAPKLRIFLEHK